MCVLVRPDYLSSEMNREKNACKLTKRIKFQWIFVLCIYYLGLFSIWNIWALNNTDFLLCRFAKKKFEYKV